MKRGIAVVIAAVVILGLYRQPAIARDRVHYIAADEITWNYVPLGRDTVFGRPLPPQSPAQLGRTYRKAVYREYTDRTFSQLAPIAPADRYRGLVGPMIHAEVGDTVIVVFRNRTRISVNIVPSDVRSVPVPAPVPPGATRTYRWPINIAEGPGAMDGSSVMYVYESDVHQSADENAGLIGPLVITRHGNARADGSPADVDREVVALFTVQDEFLNPLFPVNLADRTINPKRVSRSAKGLEVANLMATINGFSFGNMPAPVMRVGERVRWYMLSTENTSDGHAPTWTGQTVLSQGNRTDTIQLVTPHMVVDMVPDDPGVWLMACTLNIHFLAGMDARYEVVTR